MALESQLLTPRMSPSDLKKIAAQHFSKLYEEHKVDKNLQNMFKNNIQSHLTKEQQNFMSAPITKIEIENAIQSTQSGKSPGPDGISIEFYKTFCNTLTPALLKV